MKKQTNKKKTACIQKKSLSHKKTGGGKINYIESLTAKEQMIGPSEYPW